jgi:hypothetical protein
MMTDDRAIILSIVVALIVVIAVSPILLCVYAQPAPPGQPLICGGGITVLLEGNPLASGCVLNIRAGSGIVATPAADPAIGGTDLMFSYNTILIPTHDQIHANENYCESSNGTPQYTCKLPDKALLVYQRGQEFLLVIDTPCPAGCTLNIDSVGVRSIKQSDGATDPGALIVAGQATRVWFDGTVFRLI